MQISSGTGAHGRANFVSRNWSGDSPPLPPPLRQRSSGLRQDARAVVWRALTETTDAAPHDQWPIRIRRNEATAGRTSELGRISCVGDIESEDAPVPSKQQRSHPPSESNPEKQRPRFTLQRRRRPRRSAAIDISLCKRIDASARRARDPYAYVYPRCRTRTIQSQGRIGHSDPPQRYLNHGRTRSEIARSIIVSRQILYSRPKRTPCL